MEQLHFFNPYVIKIAMAGSSKLLFHFLMKSHTGSAVVNLREIGLFIGICLKNSLGATVKIVKKHLTTTQSATYFHKKTLLIKKWTNLIKRF